MSEVHVILTQHSREKMQERNLSFEELREVLVRPEVVAVDSNRRHIRDGKPRRKFFKDDLCVVVGDGHYRGEPALVVITILWRRDEQWTSDEMKGRKK